MGNGPSSTASPTDSVFVRFMPRDVFFRSDLEYTPRFQDLKQDLREREVSVLELVNRKLDNIVVVSHRHRCVTALSFHLWWVGVMCILQFEPCRPAQSKLCASFRWALSRWNKPHNPDVGYTAATPGEQFRAIGTFLEKNHKTEFVWFDFGCLACLLLAVQCPRSLSESITLGEECGVLCGRHLQLLARGLCPRLCMFFPGAKPPRTLSC